MSTTVREEYEVGDLDPVGVLEAAAEAEQSRTTRRVPQAPARRPLGRPPPRHRRHRCRDAGGAALLADESLGGDGTPAVAAFTPEPFALALGMSPSAGAQLIADALDLRHRLPLLWKRRVAGWRCRPGRPAGSPARPTASPRPPRSGSTNSSPTAASCGPVVVDRLVAQAIAAYDPEEHEDRGERRPGRLGRHPDPPRAHRLPRHLPPRSHRRHPHPQGVLRPGLRASPTSCTSTATPPARRPQDQGPRHPHRPTRSARQAAGQGVRPRRGPRPRDPTPSPSVRSRSSAPPPSPRSATWVGHHQVVIQPVLNMARRDAVDSHDPPRGCATSSSSATATASSPDAKSTPGPATSTTSIPYDPNGPPGQTTARQPRLPVPATPPRQDHRSLAIPPHARRRLPLARPLRHDVPRHRPAAPAGCPDGGTRAARLPRSTQLTGRAQWQ